MFSNFRKKHKQQIRKAERSFEVTVSSSELGVEELRLLHLRVAGRKTRSRATWKLQAQAVSEGQGFTVFVRERDGGQLVGGLFVMHSKSYGLSFSAAYVRQVMSAGAPLGHLCEWEAIKYLKSAVGAKKYILGNASEESLANDKVLNILHFKDGFGPEYALNPIRHFSLTHTQMSPEGI